MKSIEQQKKDWQFELKLWRMSRYILENSLSDTWKFWNRKNGYFNGKSPATLLKQGRYQELYQYLGRIEYGVYG